MLLPRASAAAYATAYATASAHARGHGRCVNLDLDFQHVRPQRCRHATKSAQPIAPTLALLHILQHSTCAAVLSRSVTLPRGRARQRRLRLLLRRLRLQIVRAGLRGSLFDSALRAWRRVRDEGCNGLDHVGGHVGVAVRVEHCRERRVGAAVTEARKELEAHLHPNATDSGLRDGGEDGGASTEHDRKGQRATRRRGRRRGFH
eukprot:1822047-Pleurochrysis_carterae.AAC.1